MREHLRPCARPRVLAPWRDCRPSRARRDTAADHAPADRREPGSGRPRCRVRCPAGAARHSPAGRIRPAARRPGAGLLQHRPRPVRHRIRGTGRVRQRADFRIRPGVAVFPRRSGDRHQ